MIFLQGKPQHSLWSHLLLLAKSNLGFMFLDESGTLAVFSSRPQDSYSTWSKVLLQLEYSTIRIFNIGDRLLTFLESCDVAWSMINLHLSKYILLSAMNLLMSDILDALFIRSRFITDILNSLYSASNQVQTHTYAP